MNSKSHLFAKTIMTLFICIALLMLAAFCTGCVSSTKENKTSSNTTTSTSSAANSTYSNSNSAKSNSASIPSSDVNKLPPYAEMKSSINKNIGKYYEISGRIHRVNGGFRGSDYTVYVYYDGSEKHGEFAVVRIPYNNYTESVNRFFSGTCKLEGKDDQGNPLFICSTKYSAE